MTHTEALAFSDRLAEADATDYQQGETGEHIKVYDVVPTAAVVPVPELNREAILTQHSRFLYANMDELLGKRNVSQKAGKVVEFWLERMVDYEHSPISILATSETVFTLDKMNTVYTREGGAHTYEQRAHLLEWAGGIVSRIAVETLENYSRRAEIPVYNMPVYAPPVFDRLRAAA